MSQVSGLEILQATLEAYKDTIVVVMTGNPSVTSSIEALRAGAWDYLPEAVLRHPSPGADRPGLARRDDVARGPGPPRPADEAARSQRQDRPDRDLAALPQGGGPGPKGGGDRCLGVHQRGERDRQGGHRPVHPPEQPAGQSGAGADQLRGAARAAARERDVRPPEGRLHRGRPRQAGAAGDRQRRARSSSTSSPR